MRSRVMPGSSPTIDRRLPVSRLKSVLLPTLGRPTMATSGNAAAPAFAGTTDLRYVGKLSSGKRKKDSFHHSIGRQATDPSYPAAVFPCRLAVDACKLLCIPRKEGLPMPKFVIEREIPGAGSLSSEQLQAISQKSCSVLRNLGPQITWLQSYVTDNKIYCVYIAPNEEMVREHATQGGFPANSIAQVRRVIDPTTAEG